MLRSRQILAVSRASRTSAFRLILRMRQRVSAVPDRSVFQVLERCLARSPALDTVPTCARPDQHLLRRP